MEYLGNTVQNKTYADEILMKDIVFKGMILVSILIGTSIHWFSYVALGLTVLYFFLNDSDKCVDCMFFLVPFANIFKPEPTAYSLFTCLTIFLTIKLILSKGSIDKHFLIIWLVMLSIQAVGCQGQLTTLVKQATVLLLVYGYFHCCKVNAKYIVLNLTAGIIISCVIANMTGIFNGIPDYLRMVRAYDVSVDLSRFTGLYSDPNYLSETLILLCSSLFVLIQQKRISKKYWGVIALLMLVGVQTLSKSFFLMLLVLVLLITLIAFKRKNSKLLFVIFLGIVSMIGMFLAGKLTVIDNILIRFGSQSGITTGRVAIWKRYIDKMLTYPWKLLFGFGIGNLLEELPHNTCLDYIYCYGICGSFVYLIGFRRAIKSRIRYTETTRWIPFICIMMMYFFLSNLLMFDFGYHLIIIMAFLLEKESETADGKGVVG